VEELDLRGLRAFASVAEHGSLTRAATALDVAQSALSRRITALEEALGGRLFHRTGRGTTLTEFAQTLLPRVRTMLAENDALRAQARGESSSPSGTVVLGLVPAVARPLVSSLVLRLKQEFPRIRLCALEAYSGQVEEWLTTGRIDIGLFNRYGQAGPRGAELFMVSPLVFVTKRRAGVTLTDMPFRNLSGLPLVMPPRPNSMATTVMDLAARHNVALDVVLEAGSSALIRDAVVHAGLATLVPKLFAAREYAGSEFMCVPLVKPAIRQQAWLALTSQRPASLAARTVASMVLSMAPACET
jgi:LysR family transcriptional regulator, nitrogen assimilation regulatory protein